MRLLKSYPLRNAVLAITFAAAYAGMTDAARARYLDPSQIDLVHILAPPPAPQSPEAKARRLVHLKLRLNTLAIISRRERHRRRWTWLVPPLTSLRSPTRQCHNSSCSCVRSRKSGMNFARTPAGAGTAESRSSRLQMISEYLMSLLWGVCHDVECMPRQFSSHLRR